MLVKNDTALSAIAIHRQAESHSRMQCCPIHSRLVSRDYFFERHVHSPMRCETGSISAGLYHIHIECEKNIICPLDGEVRAMITPAAAEGLTLDGRGAIIYAVIGFTLNRLVGSFQHRQRTD